MSSCLSERHSRSMNTLSIQRPRPSIEMRTPAALSTPVKAALVNWRPWSVLKISGVPKRASAEHRPARPVHDRDPIEEAPPDRNVGDVRAPDLVRPRDGKP